MNAYYLLIIVGTLVGFCALAWMLLAPIWRFLDREEQASERWTKEALARRRRQQGNGHGQGGDGSSSGRPPDRVPPDDDHSDDPGGGSSSPSAPERPAPPES